MPAYLTEKVLRIHPHGQKETAEDECCKCYGRFYSLQTRNNFYNVIMIIIICWAIFYMNNKHVYCSVYWTRKSSHIDTRYVKMHFYSYVWDIIQNLLVFFDSEFGHDSDKDRRWFVKNRQARRCRTLTHIVIYCESYVK